MKNAIFSIMTSFGERQIKELNSAMNIPNKIVGGIQDKDIPTMVDRAFREANPLYPVPKIMSRADIENIFRLIKK